MMKKAILIIVFIPFGYVGLAQELIEATVTFRINNAGLTVEGRFDSIPNIVVDQKNSRIEDMKIYGALWVPSIKTGIEIRDNHLKRSDYFDVENYPEIFLTSQRIKKQQKDQYSGEFILKIKDIEKPVEMLILSDEDKNSLTLKGRLRFNRQDFNLGEESMILSDDVDVEILAIFSN